MLREHTTLDYAIQIIGILNNRVGPVPTKDIMASISNASSYLQKVLAKMTKSNILHSSMSGYELARPVDNLTLGHMLEFCCYAELPVTEALAIRATAKLLELAHTVPLRDIL